MRPPFLMRSKRDVLGLIVSVFMAVAPSLFAEGNSTSMGLLSTVVSDGAFDAVRNPALLVFQTSQYAAGVMANSGPSSKIVVDMYNDTMSFDSVEELKLNVEAVFTFKAGSNVFGFAVANVFDEDLYKNSEIEITMRDHNEDLSANIQANMHEKETQYAPALVFSVAFPLSNAVFFGVQGSFGVIAIDMKNHVDGTIFFAIPQSVSSDLNIKTRTYVFEAGAGLVKKLDRGQVGFLLRSGKLYSSNSDGEYSASYSTPDSKSTSNPFQYVSGMNLAMGFYTQLAYSFGFAFETEYRFPAEYRNNTLEEEDGHIEEKPYMITLGNRFRFKTGVEWFGISNLRLSAGILISFHNEDKLLMSHEESEGVTRDEYKSLRFFGLTCGGSYRLSNAYLLTGTVGYLKGHINGDRNDEKFMEAVYENFSILIGVSMGL